MRSAAEGDEPTAKRRDPPTLRDRFGICQWFHHEDHLLLERTLEGLEILGVRHLRTGISWADYHRPGGVEWYDHQMAVLKEADVEVLLSVWHTPPSISLEPELGFSGVPPREPKDFADFVDVVIDRWGDAFNELELWNEPNNPYKWSRRHDPEYRSFGRMMESAGHWTRQRGKVPVLGGVCLLDLDFLDRIEALGVLDFVDVVGIHAFPGMWEPFATDWDHPDHWYGWEHRIRTFEERVAPKPVWVTEAGLASVSKKDGANRERMQVRRLEQAMEAPAERLYWYCLFDLAPDRVAIEEVGGGPREEPEYHMGLIRFNPAYRIKGWEKPAFHRLRSAFREASPAEELAAD